ncbi:hypothetical protein [Streptomyces graminilatus]|uniref:hypothetical protein n=1 Tax=Streptomyces graminilatus TaxID=1464070 RepID=UPI0006E20A93|nr:hypothetical protein [Streptomyces graminilatus]
MKEFIARHAVRLIGLLGSITPVLVARYPGVPWEALVGVGAAFLGLGEVAQRKHDTKTAAAWALAEAGQYALREIERLQNKAAAEDEFAATSHEPAAHPPYTA